MSTEAFHYEKLPGAGRRIQGIFSAAAARCSLWLGPDHLLSVDRVWMTEGYKRFYFRDIQAITVQRTNSSTIANVLFFITLALCGMAIWLISTNVESSDARVGWDIFFVIIGALFLVLLIVSLVRGVSCRCHIQTAVQSEMLPSLGRINNAKRVIARLTPLILRTQQRPSVFEAGPGEAATPITPPATAP